MNEELYELLLKLPKENLINIMWNALDEMQAHNMRTRMFCIMESIGAIEKRDKHNRIKYSVPKINIIKEYTSTMGL